MMIEAAKQAAGHSLQDHLLVVMTYSSARQRGAQPAEDDINLRHVRPTGAASRAFVQIVAVHGSHVPMQSQ